MQIGILSHFAFFSSLFKDAINSRFRCKVDRAEWQNGMPRASMQSFGGKNVRLELAPNMPYLPLEPA